MVKAIVDKIKDAEVKAQKLIQDAEAKAGQNVVQFSREREKRLEKVRSENEGLMKEAIADADSRAKKEESAILDEALKEMNSLRAAADKKKEEAIVLIIKKIVEQ